MVTEVQDYRCEPAPEVSLETLACLILQALAIVAPAREEGQPPFIADALDDADQRVLLNPDFWPITLAEPQVFAILVGGGRDDVGRVVPASMGMDFSSAVFDCIPVDQAGAATIFDDRAKPLVFGLLVFDERPSNELLEKLPQGECETLGLVFRDHDVGVLNYRRGRFAEFRLDKGFSAHASHPSFPRASRARALSPPPARVVAAASFGAILGAPSHRGGASKSGRHFRNLGPSSPSSTVSLAAADTVAVRASVVDPA
jgi:hypothetical protein